MGHELFYRDGDRMMAVDVTTQLGFSAGKPKMLFEGRYVMATLTQPDYDVWPNGQRFVMVKESDQATSATQIVVVQNWFDELKQKAPTAKK